MKAKLTSEQHEMLKKIRPMILRMETSPKREMMPDETKALPPFAEKKGY